MLNDRRQPSASLFDWLPAVAVVFAGCAVQADSAASAKELAARPSVQFTVDLWPGEGIPVIEARRAVLRLRAAADPASRVVDTLRARIGQRLVFDSTRVQTIETGRIRVLTPMRVAGRDMGDVTQISLDQYYSPTRGDVSLPVPASATIEFLQYRAEGTCFIRIERRVIDAQPCPGFGKESVTVEREPATRWWIRVQGQRGAFGWVLVSDSTAQAVRREF